MPYRRRRRSRRTGGLASISSVALTHKPTLPYGPTKGSTSGYYRRRRRRTGGFNVGNFANDLAAAVPQLVKVGQGIYDSFKRNKTSGMYRRRRRRRTGGINAMIASYNARKRGPY